MDTATLTTQLADIVKALDTTWVLVAAVLVFFMQAGFALLEAGLCRAKNAGHTAMKNFMIFALATVMFWVVGFGVAFGAGSEWFGSTGFLFDAATDAKEVFASLSFADIPLWVKFLFQVVFLGASLAIVWGGMAERTKFAVYLIFGVLFSSIVYPVVAHWVWGGGWLGAMGMQDFAGSTVVHLQGAMAALAGSILLGPRIGKFDKDGKPRVIAGHNIPLVILGTFILWLGWFGFNPGSTLSALKPEPGFFAYVAFTTNLAAACGFLAGLLGSWVITKKADILMGINGALAALVAITAACAFVTPAAAALIGAVAGLLAYWGVGFIEKFKIDDPVGAVAVHGFGGIWGTLALGFFAEPTLVKLIGIGKPGLFYGGGWEQFIVQLKGIVGAGLYVFIAAFVIFYILKVTIGIRLSAKEEETGLDLSEHNIDAYPETKAAR